MRKNIKPLHDATQKLMYRIDADTDAFTEFQVGMRLPKGTEEEKKIRNDAMQKGLKTAIDVPLATMKIANMCWDCMIELAKVGNINSKSDLQVGECALAQLQMSDLTFIHFIFAKPKEQSLCRDRSSLSGSWNLGLLQKRRN